MPTTNQSIARRIGRIVFGAVLLGGVLHLVTASLRWLDGERSFDAARIVTQTWLLAAIAGAAARAVAGRVRLSGTADRLLAQSVVVPAVGIALLLPVTLHMPVVVLIGDIAAFDFWVVLSLWITGLAHLVFATTLAIRSYNLVVGKPAWSVRKIYVVTVVTSCVPFILLYAIPPVLVAITALLCLPVPHAIERIIARERDETGRLPHALPRAVVIAASRD